MATHRYLALLRGVNVGGNNVMKMADLKACFEGMGFDDAATYIQSGNVLFSSSETDAKKLEGKIGRGLSKRFSYDAWLLLLTGAGLGKIVAGAPPGFGSRPDEYRYNVIFLKPPAGPEEVIAELVPREGVDAAVAGGRVLYFTNLMARASQSRLSRLVSLPAYQHLTIRNWNTTTKLNELLRA